MVMAPTNIVVGDPIEYLPPPSLQHLLTSSRPYERRDQMNCRICTGDNHVCMMKCVVYKVVCESCQEFYIGETARPRHCMIDEHIRALRSPQNYPENPFSRHRTHRHARDPPPRLQVSVLNKNVIDPVERKIREAMVIKEQMPPINIRDEMRNTLELITV
ncbi:hypothetical protein ANCDUO_00494 [Ancylostoma duodenale]|uniref:Uncharacterized protein n=1 Tax=Ancylostoma duodenale TaxID=51022 RepID=A0A0C2DGS0_9BILA|nr:hypothetical protein ANCDUO_00494 [Ancylostoma duodenale]